jgi:hypothetical protein
MKNVLLIVRALIVLNVIAVAKQVVVLLTAIHPTTDHFHHVVLVAEDLGVAHIDMMTTYLVDNVHVVRICRLIVIRLTIHVLDVVKTTILL